MYAITTRFPGTHEPRLGYIGQSRRPAEVRLEEHRSNQPWGDLITEVVVIERGLWTDDELNQVELRYIERGVSVPGLPHQRPAYNIVGNLNNPHRIPPWEAASARRLREPGWTSARESGSRTARSRVRRTSRSKTVATGGSWLRHWRGAPHGVRAAAGILVGWLFFTLALFAMRDAWTGWNGFRSAALVSAVTVGTVWWWARRRRRSRRKRRR